MRRALIILASALLLAGCRDGVKGEGQPSDASTSEDAGSDTGSDGPEDVASVETYCDIVTPPPIFCDDFEGVFKDFWDNKNRTPDQGELNGGKLSLDDTLFTSPEFSARIETPPLVDKSQSAGAILVRTIHDPPPDLMFEGEFRVVTEYWPDAGTSLMPVLTLVFTNIGTIFVYRTASGTPGFSITLEGGTPNMVNLSKPFPVGEWKTLSVVVKNHPVDETGPHGELKIRIDDLDAGADQLPPEFQAATEVKMIYGAVASGPIGAFAMNLDDVRVYDRSDL